MGYYLLTAETEFSASHTLPGVELCERFHGHNWNVKLTVRVSDDGLDTHGMGLDFRIIENAVKQATAEFDHRYMNEIEPFDSIPPTAENIARIVSERVSVTIAKDGGPLARVAEVEVWETPKYRVVFRPK